MPEKGIKFIQRSDLMSYEELLRFSKIMVNGGVNKIRITGGEPFVRKDLIVFLEALSQICPNIHLTSNGTYIKDHIEQLEKIGLKSINLSLDSLQPDRFAEISRRPKFYEEVMQNLHHLKASRIPLKINMVVQAGINEDEIVDFLQLAKSENIEVRFIEEMPFNGFQGELRKTSMNYADILSTIVEAIGKEPQLQVKKNSSGLHYRCEGYKGSFAIIPAFSRKLCSECNRIRLTPQGALRTCLYGKDSLSIRDMFRAGQSDEEISLRISQLVLRKAKDGFEAENEALDAGNRESMATIGG